MQDEEGGESRKNRAGRGTPPGDTMCCVVCVCCACVLRVWCVCVCVLRVCVARG